MFLLAVTANHPPQRPWIPLTRPNRTRPTCIFTVMCYNVLCDKYATRQMYGYCPSWALDWEYRKKGILDEIRHYAADIISLQEVETDQFYNFFLPELKHEGYDGIFSPKSRAKTMAENDRKYVDGCAIFYRTAKFTLIKEHLVEFNQLAMANAEGSDNMLNRVMPKDNIGLAALLRTKEAAWDNGK
ncbi:CCR4-NOT transcription complex subunit 6 [Dufourea novaeangliae]|uniref:CCR4-NOT transcription complex subunit 6 n=1 Tax=Dufourea novaeangliae TaxID=178035 RepID=A0A154PM43_DUFNO|nr:CCR4-NOT transcription complex subunit 6 [Dufourea novaeangliae]